MPMDRNFTLLTFSDINTKSIDLIADAYAYEYVFADLITLLDAIEHSPGERCISDLLEQL